MTWYLDALRQAQALRRKRRPSMTSPSLPLFGGADHDHSSGVALGVFRRDAELPTDGWPIGLGRAVILKDPSVASR